MSNTVSMIIDLDVLKRGYGIRAGINAKANTLELTFNGEYDQAFADICSDITNNLGLSPTETMSLIDALDEQYTRIIMARFFCTARIKTHA